MADIKILTNFRYSVLEYMYDNRDKENVVKLTQIEIATALNLNKNTVNTIFKELKESGYISDNVHIGRYNITQTGIKTVELFRKTEK